jgi:hypothetical protein
MSRKREWSDGLRPSAYESDASTSTSTEPTDSSSEGGEAITSDLKRLRVAYNYDGEHRGFFSKSNYCATDLHCFLGAHGVRWAGEDSAMDTDMQTPRAKEVRSAYADANSMLREFHYLRQLRKFQAERGRARANYLKRQEEDRNEDEAMRKA